MRNVVKVHGKKYYVMIIQGKLHYVPLDKLEYANEHGITKTAIRNRLNYGWTIKKACTEGIIDESKQSI
ncbi:hypothetical protein QVA48_01535 [Staphylococcus haemolyticus]|uniref:hypothetical protein n=1 Tax=Staphylococcus haemolyticus TaxID=1283 RepID=UPI0029010784|nr:hypothetical protein [Staphylococcus haemolyticus]MDU0433891.1 hypothetical protein [Staphylococcus haemolyticus]